VLLIDLDNFKEVNDTFGHMAGDDLLKGIAGLLRHRLRNTDTLARVGGDEFAVLLPQTGADQAQVVADELVKALSRQTAVLASQSIRITASVGVALFDRLGATDVLARADLAMYEAKHAGRNRFVICRPGTAGMDPESARHQEAERIRQAIQEEQFVIFWQPILDLESMKISQYEILLRLPGSDDCEPLLPSSFLYVAERFGLIMAIDAWVVRKAIALISAHGRRGRRLVLHVNLSGKSICDPAFVGIVEAALVEGEIDPPCLVLEITETAAIANLEQARVFADRLRTRGCLLALDDFGAGFASFFYLKNFPFDYLKIDGEFIRGLSANPVDRLVVQAIVGLARGMGKKTVAEFVGDADTVRLLREIGVDYAQGYHVGPPRPVTEADSPL
jgi:diguanylate cyclase (GGDEF)-like protein